MTEFDNRATKLLELGNTDLEGGHNPGQAYVRGVNLTLELVAERMGNLHKAAHQNRELTFPGTLEHSAKQGLPLQVQPLYYVQGPTPSTERSQCPMSRNQARQRPSVRCLHRKAVDRLLATGMPPDMVGTEELSTRHNICRSASSGKERANAKTDNELRG